MIYLIGYLVLHIICGIIVYGIEFAYWQRSWPELAGDEIKIDKRRALFSAVFGPIGLLVAVITIQTNKGFKGFKYK